MHKKVAVVAQSSRFPGTNSNNLWNDLLEKKDLITEVDSSRWDKETFLHPNIKHPGTSYTFAAGSIGDISLFDADFFGISPREAVCMDPQQRLLLEMAWETFENSGKAPSQIRGSNCGVFIGLSCVDYAYRVADDLAAMDATSGTGNTTSIAANRLSYFFDLHGPSMVVDTACSSAMVAFHLACQSIRTGESTQALTGGIHLHAHPFGFITFSKATMLSKTGHCHVFDEASDGYVRSEGGGLFLLKDYNLAVKDGDPILAIVAGSAVNTDGSKQGLTIPRAKAQEKLMSEVYQQAGIDSNEIDYLEAHGTGTAVGDPIETKAISQALGLKREKPLLIGSIKSNLGHLESASGVAGLAKAIGCLNHRSVPATIGINKPNPNIQFDDWNLKVVTDTTPLKEKGTLTVGINSFGFGGANAHVILQSPSSATLTKKNHINKVQTLPLIISAKNSNGLSQGTLELANFLETSHRHSFYDIAHTAFFRREQHQQNALVFSQSPEDAAKKLKGFNEEIDTQNPEVYTGLHLSNAQGPVFIYSGNGCQWLTMGKQLLNKSPVFKHTLAKIDNIFSQYAPYTLSDVLNNVDNVYTFDKTEIAQPALFALQVGITEFLRDKGIRPIAVCGHSVGEVAAAWACGALSLDDAVKVIYYRSLYQGKTKGQGQMTAVSLSQQSIETLLSENGLTELNLAGINSHKGVTISGSVTQLSLMEAELTTRNVFFKRLELDYAFHSHEMDSIESGILNDLSLLNTQASTIPFFSTVTGTELNGDQLDAKYWWFNIRKPVLFHQAVSAIVDSGINTFIEISAHPVLTYYLQETLKELSTEGIIIPSVIRNNDSISQVMSCVAKTIISGVNFEDKTWFPVKGNPVKLPNYPWQREKFWHPVTTESHGLLNRKKIHPLLGYPLPQHTLVWENQLDPQKQPYLTDHNVGGSIIFPGAGYIEMALAAAHQLSEDDFIDIEELEIQAPLVLNDTHSKVVRLSVKSEDHRFDIKSREHASSNNWSQHVVGRVLSKATGSKLNIETPIIPECAPNFKLADHTLLTESTGLAYGPSFQSIQYGWSDKSTALGIFEIPDSIKTTLDQYYLHPSLLDCTFQLVFQILKEEIKAHEGIAFIPIKMGRIHLRTSKKTPYFAKATLLQRSPHSLNASFSLFDADGQAIAVIYDARFRAVKLHRPQAQSLHYLDYHLTAAPLGINTDMVSLNSLSFFYDIIKKAQNEVAFRRYSEEIEPLLDSLCSQFIAEFLSEKCDASGFLSNYIIDEQQKNNPETAALIQHIIAVAEENGLLEVIHDKGWLILQNNSVPKISATVIWNALVQDYPDYFYLINLVGRIGSRLMELINGDIQATEMGITPALYIKITRHIHEQTSKNVLTEAFTKLSSEIIDSLSAGERLNFLEISADKPSFASFLCSRIDFTQCNYNFLGLTDEAVDTAELLRERFPLLEVSHVENVSADSALANIAIINLDFVDANDLHQLLIRIPTLLMPGSKVFFIGLQPAGWIDTILGTSHSWWVKQQGKQALSPQLKSDWVVKKLSSIGFSLPTIQEFTPNSFSGIYLIETETENNHSTLIHPTEKWLILSSQDENELVFSQKIAQQLEEKGQTVILKNTCDDFSVDQELLKTENSTESYNHIIHLANIENDTASIQTERCSLATEIIQACESTQTNATCWLFTRNVGTTIPCDQNQNHLLKRTSDGIAHDSALWGFGRTLLNEASNYKVKLLDSCGNIHNNSVINSLVTELLHTNSEQEVFINSTGNRYVPKLRMQAAPGVKDQENHAETMRLSFDFPGQLRFLHWKESPTVSPANDEVEVETKATGLNFRDIMYTLGLLSDEAIENGFVGPTLGLEFAGIITKVGVGVTEFSIGDHVVGFASASFSNRIVTKTNAITHIPKDMAFTAAATIPSTFFTVYYALHHQARLQPGEKILIHGAAGGVGIAAIQIARWLGAEIYATVGAEEKRDFLNLTGIKHIYNSRTLDFAEEILEQTGNTGVDVVLNSLAGEAINRNFQLLKPFGRFLELGKRDFYENTHIGLRPFRNNISYFGIDVDQMMKECPDLTRQLFAEMMQLFHKGILHPLPYTTFDANQVIDAFRYMQQAKQIGKVVITYDNDIYRVPAQIKPPKQSLQLKHDASYLVTGGLNGFGLRTAEWLVEKGAKHLILISRSGPTSDQAKAALNNFKKHGIKVLASACDVSDKKALKKLLAQCEIDMPQLKGIIHSAAVIDDGLARNLDQQQISRVLKPKIIGAQNLHDLTLTKSLDLFVLYSSATTLFGNPGQSNYVAANMWLEALSAHRHQLGLAATCVRWGAIEDVGFLARNVKIKEALQHRMGGSALSSSVALDQLEQMIMHQCNNIGILEFEWRALNSFLPTATSPKFSEITLQSSDNGENNDNYSDIEILLEELSDEELKSTFIDMLKKELSQILLIAEEKINAESSMYDIGLDSLMGVELMVAIESRFNVQIPMMSLTDSPTLSKLTDRIIVQLRGENAEQSSSPDIHTQITDLSSRHDAEIKPDQIDDLVDELQSNTTLERLIN